jgi:hypothetical protein
MTLLNTCPDSMELTADQVSKAYQEFPVKEETPAEKFFRMREALKWSTVLIEAGTKGQLTGMLRKEALEQIEKNQNLYL